MARRINTRAGSAKRIESLIVVVLVFTSLVAIRALWVQGIDANGAAATAIANLTTKPQVLPATRGTITDRNGTVLGETLPYVRIIADPYGIATNGISRGTALSSAQQVKADQAPDAIAQILMTDLGGSTDDYLGHLTAQYRSDGTPNQYEPVAANVPAYTWAKIVTDMNQGGWYGLSSEQTPLRVYPDGTLASNVLGFVGSDGNGLAGLELSQNASLKGIDGQSSSERGAYGIIPLGANTLVPAVNGDNVELTLDATMQLAAQQEITSAVNQFGADWGTAIVMNVKTGEVLAMADAQTFDNNNFGQADPSTLGNAAVETTFEPGSVQKLLTMSALIDQGLITPDTRVVVPPSVESGGYAITDSEAHGTWYLTARGVVAYSSNIGAVLLARQSSKQELVDYLDSFGLGKPTGIQLPGEGNLTLGIVPDASMPDYQRDRIAFGQSISVTPMQEAAAVAAIANGGVYIQPTIIKSVTTADGTPVPQPAQETHRVISAETSSEVVNMMESVTESPMYVDQRSIPGYTWAGKTGTAQRVNPATGQYQGWTGSFVGVAPANDPTILVYVVLDNPASGTYGATIAMPAAKDLMTLAMPHYGFAPTGNPPYTDPITYQP